MAPFQVGSKVCIAPNVLQSKFKDFALNIKGSNADSTPHMAGNHADFLPHMEQRHS